MSEQSFSSAKNVFVIAGEHSGDALGAGLMRSLKRKHEVQFQGVGGPLMEEQGLKSMLPMEELAVMGIWEVVWQLSRLLKLIHGMVEEIEAAQPDVVVTIDLPDFNFRVAQRLKKRGIYKGKIVHYVAPSVWAWRPGRAKKIAQFLDGLMCLFPFEPQYFECHGLETAYVGHPIINRDRFACDREGFRAARGIADDVVIGLFFGSRERELSAHNRVMIDAVFAVQEQIPNVSIVAPTTESLEFNVRGVLQDVPELPSYIVTKQDVKWDAVAACDVAVAVSGTVGLELAYMNVPHVIAYKTSPLTALLLRLLIKVRYAHLANILLDKPAVEEFLQGRCKALNIARGTLKLLKDEDAAFAQRQEFDALRAMLSAGVKSSPSDEAADFVVKTLSF